MNNVKTWINAVNNYRKSRRDNGNKRNSKRENKGCWNLMRVENKNVK
jgi:hypothetical protein